MTMDCVPTAPVTNSRRHRDPRIPFILITTGFCTTTCAEVP